MNFIELVSQSIGCEWASRLLPRMGFLRLSFQRCHQQGPWAFGLSNLLRSLRPLNRILLVSLSLSSPWARADWMAERCHATPVKDSRVAGRASQVHLPNGKDVIVVGHVHGYRQIYNIVEATESNLLNLMPNSSFADYFKKILAENAEPFEGTLTKKALRNQINMARESLEHFSPSWYDLESAPDIEETSTLVHAQQDEAFLKDQITSTKDSPAEIGFVGFEGSPQVLAYNFPHYRKAYVNAQQQWNLRNNKPNFSLSAKDLELSFLSSMTGPMHYFISDPTRLKTVRWVGTESEEILEENGGISPLKVMRGALNELTNADDQYFDRLSPKEQSHLEQNQGFLEYFTQLNFLYADVEYMRIDSLEALESRLKLMGPAPSWIRKEFRWLHQTMKDRIQKNIERDQATAEALLAATHKIHKSGIHFVGLNHWPKIIRHLENLCQKEILNHYFPLQPLTPLDPTAKIGSSTESVLPGPELKDIKIPFVFLDVQTQKTVAPFKPQ